MIQAIIELPGQAMSLKNSKQIIKAGQSWRIIPSKPYERWAEAVLWQLKVNENIGREWRYPLRASFHFYRKTRHRFDYINLAQGPLDLLVEAGIINEDDMHHIIPGDFSWSVDKNNPRTIIKLEEI